MKMTGNPQQVSAAAQLLTIEIISELLLSTSPPRLGEVLTEYLRELSGAKTVMVLANRPEPGQCELLNVSPLRRVKLFSPAEINCFCNENAHGELPILTDDLPADQPLQALMVRNDIHSLVRYPLRVSGEQIGMLLLFDLPGIDRIGETSHIIDLLASPIALALKNALAFRQIEQQALMLELRVEERTAELRESEERYRLAIQATNVGIWEWNISTNQGIFSPRWCEIVGYSFDDPELEHSFNSWAERIHPDDYQQVMSALTAHLEHGVKYNVVYRHRHKSGEYRWQNSRGQAFTDLSGKPLKMVGCISDITEHKRAEAALAESEQRFRILAEASFEGIAITEQGIVKDCSELLANMLGLERSELLGRTALEFISPVHRDLVVEAQRTGRAEPYEHLMLRADGTEFPVEVRARTAQFNGHLVRITAIRDISSRKQAEVELQKKNADMEQFIYTVSHDLRTPLVTIKTFMGYLEGDMAGGDRERVAQDLQFIHSAADKMKLLLDELLEISRVDRVEIPHVRISLLEVLTEVLDTMAGVIDERNVDIRLPETDPVLLVDRQRFSQIWQNLIENAIKYSRKDSIPRIELDVRQDGGETIFIVSDNGIGIDPRYHSRIFGIFDKLDPKSPGAGLGLSMVQRIVEKSGGRVWVESQGNDSGACFFFTLPHAMDQN